MRLVDSNSSRKRLAVEVFAGVCGGLIAVAVTVVLRSLIRSSLLAELVLDATTLTLSPGAFERLLDTLGPKGKPLLFSGVVAYQLVVYVAAWLLSARAGLPPARRVLLAVVVSTSLLLLSTMTLGPISGSWVNPRRGWAMYVAITGSASLAGACFSALLSTSMTPAISAVQVTQAGELGRRRFLSSIALVSFSALGAVLIGRRVVASGDEGARGVTTGRPTEPVTPSKDFYIVTKNLIDPDLDASSWRLRVGGSTQRRLELSYADVIARRSTQQYTTLQCVSNNVGGPLISNALWEGFPLGDLLDEAQPLSSAGYVVFRSEDDYEESIPLAFAHAEGVMLAHQMNGEPLPRSHGFPLRLLSPGKYGFKHPKWIKEIVLMNAETDGYWEKRYWSQEARMNTSSRIDLPSEGNRLSVAATRVEGIAFSGNRGISRVEVSLDGGDTWREAVLERALSPYTWVLWHYDWRWSGAGRTNILARATDGTGEVQTATEAFPHPSGATGYPHVTVTRIASLEN